MIRRGLQALILVVILVFVTTGISYIAIAPAASGNAQITCSEVQPQDISQLFSRWNASLQSGKPSEVVKNYAEDAILLPTASNKVRHNHREIQDYFDQFLALKPVGQIVESDVKTFCNVAIDSGIYSFTLTQNGQIKHVQARYSFVYQKTDNGWLIVEHHSSFMPEKL